MRGEERLLGSTYCHQAEGLAQGLAWALAWGRDQGQREAGQG